MKAENDLNKEDGWKKDLYSLYSDIKQNKRNTVELIMKSLKIQIYKTAHAEKPETIIEEIKSGIVKSNYKVIENRKEAIESAIKNCGKNAVVLIAGKGHEEYQEIDGIKKHFSDRETAKKYLGI